MLETFINAQINLNRFNFVKDEGVTLADYCRNLDA
jgi:hypothetical protein